MLHCYIDKLALRGRLLLEKFEFQVAPGELVVVAGQSGVGKSTLLRLLAGLLEQSAGIAVACTRRIASGIAEEQLAFVAQDPDANVICGDVASELLIHGGSGCGRASAVLLGLRRELLMRQSDSLSGGEKQVLALACAVARNCRIYLLDEPTAMLDKTNTELVIQAVKDLVRQGAGVVVASHEPEIWFADRVVNLGAGDGRKKGAVPVAEATRWYKQGVVAESLEVEGLGFRYRNSDWLFRSISCTLTSGEMLWVHGPNGSGKSTFSELLSRLRKPSEGRIMLGGVDISSIKRYLPQKVGLCVQNPNHHLLFPTVEEEVSKCGPRSGGPRSSEWTEYVNRILLLIEDFGIPRHLDPRLLSFGQRKLLSFLSFNHLPDLLILDEPEVGLDQGLREFLWECIETRRRHGFMSMVISHGKPPCQELKYLRLG